LADRIQDRRAAAKAFPVVDAHVTATAVGQGIFESLPPGFGFLRALIKPFGRRPPGSAAAFERGLDTDVFARIGSVLRMVKDAVRLVEASWPIKNVPENLYVP
jgi:hypothetical protein